MISNRPKTLAMTILIGYIFIMNKSFAQQPGQSENTMPKPTPAQIAWQEAELGVVIHYDLHVFDNKHYSQPENRQNPYDDPNIFNPTKLDTDQWVKTAKDMGARFAILTASHETGFRLWQSDANPYCLKAVKWGNGKRDIVGEFVNSCRKQGLKPCIYLGTRWNSHLGVLDFKVTERSAVTQDQYNRMIEKEVAEICSRYGDLFELWFDGGAHGKAQGGPDVLGVFEKHQQNCLFYHSLDRADARWGGSESGTVPYPCWATFPYKSTGSGESTREEIRRNGFALLKHGDPNGKYWMPAMSDAPLRNHEWFWDAGDDYKIYPLDALVNMYYNSVGHNSTLIIGLCPDNTGLIPDADVKRCREFGDTIRKIFSDKIAETKDAGKTIELTFPEPSRFNHIVMQEQISEGERVRRYELEALTPEGWKKIGDGACIGHKNIYKTSEIKASAVRLEITESTAEPIIKNLAVYYAGK